MSGLWGKLKSLFISVSPPKEKNGEKLSDFDKYYDPEVIGESHILSEKEIEFIDRNLPERMVGVKWVLKYSTQTDGYSLATLYRKLKGWDNPVLLVIEDDCGYKFGAFGTESFRPDYKVRGTFECFVFRLKHQEFQQRYGKKQSEAAEQQVRHRSAIRQPSQESTSSTVSNMSEYEVVDVPPSGLCNEECQENGERCPQSIPNGDKEETGDQETGAGNDVMNSSGACGLSLDDWMLEYDFSEDKVWAWTSLKNSVFIHGEIRWLRFGLHDGTTALWVDEDLRFGGSDGCKIFNNERLAPNPDKFSNDHTFRIVKVEVWGFKQ